MRCPSCDKSILSELRWDNWIKVVNFIRCLELEENITPATANEMTESMMSFKLYALGEEGSDPIHVDTEYYKTVVTTQTDPEILRKELLDLIDDVEKERKRRS